MIPRPKEFPKSKYRLIRLPGEEDSQLLYLQFKTIEKKRHTPKFWKVSENEVWRFVPTPDAYTLKNIYFREDNCPEWDEKHRKFIKTNCIGTFEPHMDLAFRLNGIKPFLDKFPAVGEYLYQLRSLAADYHSSGKKGKIIIDQDER